MPGDPAITAIYHVICPPGEDIRTLARAMAVEQTVEVPEALITAEINRDIIGIIASIEPIAAQPTVSSPLPAPPTTPAAHHRRFAVTINYRASLAADHLPQLLNLIYGNISIHGTVRLIDLTLPPEILAGYRGPNYGIEGLRKLTGVHGRPLVCTAIKPRGASLERFVEIARSFALAGGDIVKDDHNLVDGGFDAFRERVSACNAAVRDANRTTGRNCLYVPYLSCSHDELDARLHILASEDIRGILVGPMIMGLETLRWIAANHDLFILTHPTFTGSIVCHPDHGIEPGIFMGTIMRLAGADVSIFTNFGGRFAPPRAECESIARRMREPLGRIRPGFPSPAGGMRFENLPDLAATYGPDTVLLVGGALLTRHDNVTDGTRALLSAIRDRFDERLTEPDSQMRRA